MRSPKILTADDLTFPDPQFALREPNGLLALGGDLSVPRLLSAYRRGIFPWYSQPDPILWWSPDPRVILLPEDIRVNRSLKKFMRQDPYRLCFDTNFAGVVAGCAAPRADQDGTWITLEMQAAYLELFNAGHAHSIEVWENDQLVGGLYGLAIGRAFFGESMFSTKPNASKIALVALARQLQEWQFAFIDCQMPTEHLLKMGASEITRSDYLDLLSTAVDAEPQMQGWVLDEDMYW